MSITHLENLARIGKLKSEPGVQAEFDGLMKSGRARLADAYNKKLALESRFDLAYNAAHSLALAALRWHGYRSTERYVVFQALEHTLGVDAKVWRILAKTHDRRNLSEYEGCLEIDEVLLADLLNSAAQVEAKVIALGSIPI